MFTVLFVVPFFHCVFELADSIDVSVDFDSSVLLWDVEVIFVVAQSCDWGSLGEFWLQPLDCADIDKPSKGWKIDCEFDLVSNTCLLDSLNVRTVVVLVIMHPHKPWSSLGYVDPILKSIVVSLSLKVLEGERKIESFTHHFSMVQNVTWNDSVNSEALFVAELNRLWRGIALVKHEEMAILLNKVVFYTLKVLVEAFSDIAVPRSTDTHHRSKSIHVVLTDNDEGFRRQVGHYTLKHIWVVAFKIFKQISCCASVAVSDDFMLDRALSNDVVFLDPLHSLFLWL